MPVRKWKYAWVALAAWASAAAGQEASTPAVPWEGATIRSLQVLGTAVPAPTRLFRELELAPGRRYDTRRAQQARLELLATGRLRELRLLPSLVAPDSLVIVVIVQPAPRAKFVPIVHMRADDRFVFGGRMHLWGGAGRGESLSLALAGGGEKRLQLEWSEPRPVLALPVGALVQAHLLQEVETGEDDIVFDRSMLGVKLMVPPRGPRLELAGSLWQVRADDGTALLSEQGTDHFRAGSIAFAWGRAPALFSWSHHDGNLGIGATSGDVEQQDFHGELRAARALTSHCVVAAGLAFRTVRGTVPRYDRLHLGGGPSLRGHAYGTARGDAGTWGGVEARFPINFWNPQSFARVSFPFALHVFVDGGSAWGASAPGATTTATAAAQAELRWSAGAGLFAHVGRAYPVLLELGRDDGGAWRGEFRTAFAF